MFKIFSISLSIATLLITSSPVQAKKIRLRTVNEGRHDEKYVISVETWNSKNKIRYFQIVYDYPTGRGYGSKRERRRKYTHVAKCSSYEMSNAIKTESFDKNNKLISLNRRSYASYRTPSIQSFEEKALQLTCK